MPGRDWNCNNCGFKNFAKRYDCMQCKQQLDVKEEDNDGGQGWGTWYCDNCGGNHRKDTFLKCPHPGREYEQSPGSSGGQWQNNDRDGQRQKRGGGWQNSGWQNDNSKFSKGQYKNPGSSGGWGSGGYQQGHQAQQGGQAWAGNNSGRLQQSRGQGSREAQKGNKGGGGNAPKLPQAPTGEPPKRVSWKAQEREEAAATAEEADENSVKCDGCNLLVHYSKMMKTHQLGGNTRKETRCPTCHEDYQMGIYASQMLESVYTCASNMDRFSNWADNEDVKVAILHLLEKGIDQLGLTMRAVHAEKVVDAESGDGAVAAAEQKDADGESSVATGESQWEVLEGGGKIILEQATEQAEA